MGSFFKEFLMKKYPSLNDHAEHYNGFNSATAAYFAATTVVVPFASRPLFGIGGRVAYCDAGVTPPNLTEDYLNSLRTASETVFQQDTLNHMTKDYSIDMMPLFSAYRPRSLALITLRSFLLYYLPLMAPKVDDDIDLDEHPVDWIVPFKKSVKQVFCDTTVTTTRRVLERFFVRHCSQRVAWKLLKDVPKSCIRKADRGCLFILTSFVSAKQHLEILGIASSWLVQVGFECFYLVCDILKANDELENVVDDHTERVKVFRKKVYGATARCGSALVLGSIVAGIGATIFRPASGQAWGHIVGDLAGPQIVTAYLEL